MIPTRQLLTVASLLALLGVSGCVWERDMHQRDRYHDNDRRDPRGEGRDGYQRDRNGQPCIGDRHEGDGRHDEDCRPEHR